MSSLELAKPAVAWRERLALFASVTCLVHCVGLVVLAPLLPGAVALVAHDIWLELSLWGASVALSARSVWLWPRSPSRVVAIIALAAALGLGAWGLAGKLHWPVEVSLVLLVLLQIGVLAHRAAAHRRACRPAAGPVDCCNHQG